MKNRLAIASLAPLFMLLVILLSLGGDIVPTQEDCRQLTQEISTFKVGLGDVGKAIAGFRREYAATLANIPPSDLSHQEAANAMLAVEYVQTTLDMAEVACMAELTLARAYATRGLTFPGQEKQDKAITQVLRETQEQIRTMAGRMTGPELIKLRESLLEVFSSLKGASATWPLPMQKKLDSSKGKPVIVTGPAFRDFSRISQDFSSFFKALVDEADKIAHDSKNSQAMSLTAYSYALAFKAYRVRTLNCMVWGLLFDLTHNLKDVPGLAHIEDASRSKLFSGVRIFEGLHTILKTQTSSPGNFLKPEFMQEYDKIYDQWRASLVLALDSDGLTLDGLAAN